MKLRDLLEADAPDAPKTIKAKTKLGMFTFTLNPKEEPADGDLWYDCTAPRKFKESGYLIINHKKKTAVYNRNTGSAADDNLAEEEYEIVGYDSSEGEEMTDKQMDDHYDVVATPVEKAMAKVFKGYRTDTET